MYVARNRGVAGFVTDGLVRDLDDLETVGLPIFAMGVTPNSPQRRGPGSVGLPIVCGGVSIATGDIVVGDRDGVVVVPRARIEETLERSRARQGRGGCDARACARRTEGAAGRGPRAAKDRQGLRRRQKSQAGGGVGHDRFSNHRFPHPSARPAAVRLFVGEGRAGAQARLDPGRSRQPGKAVRARRLRLCRGRRRHAAISRRGRMGRRPR